VNKAWDDPGGTWFIRLAWGGFTYTTREKARHRTNSRYKRKTHAVPLPPIFGAVALIGGVVLLVAAKRHNFRPAASTEV